MRHCSAAALAIEALVIAHDYGHVQLCLVMDGSSRPHTPAPHRSGRPESSWPTWSVRGAGASFTGSAAFDIKGSGLTPNRRMDRPITHIAAGGLSTVMVLPASSAANSQAFQDCEPACAAAA